MSTGSESENKIYTQINELVDIGEIPKYIDILVCKNMETKIILYLALGLI